MNRNFILVSGFVVLLVTVFLVAFFASLSGFPGWWFGGKQKIIVRHQPTVNNQQPTFIPTPPATPTPLQGPGNYACDPIGVCNIYTDTKSMGCPKTYADPKCLEECGEKTNRCQK